MFEVKYYKDYRHNYLILKDNGCLSENIYQRKMVTENKIKGLLDSQERYINGEVLLYYEITSKQSLFSIYDGKSIGMEQLRKFFIQLKVVNDMLQKYLLDGSCLVLQPEYVFQNIATGEYFFLYYPDPEEESLLKLIDFFIARVDNTDMEAVETVYKIADLISREQFVLDEVLKWFQDDLAGEDKENNLKRSNVEEIPCHNEEDRDICRENNEDNKEDKHSKCGYSVPEAEKRTIGKLILMWVPGAVIIGVLVYIMLTYELSYKEEIYLTAGWVIAAVMVIGSIVWYFYPGIMERENKGKEHGEEEESYDYVPAYEDIIPMPAKDAGNTIYVPFTENCENKLYSLDRKNKCHIDLLKLPLTVGKLAGAVDLVIDEQSLSRMHAKFSKSGNNVYVTDLNSTNGTFRNGMRLMPNASELIEPGDEIRLGKLKFIYR